MASDSSPAYKVSDLVGCKVFTETGECIGELADVLPTGGNDVFVVKNGSKEILVPALLSVVSKIDLIERRLEVTLPPGLRELYEAL